MLGALEYSLIIEKVVWNMDVFDSSKNPLNLSI